MVVWSVVLDVVKLFEEQLGRSAAESLSGLGDGGQRHGGRGGELDVVVSDQGDVVGYA